MKVSEDFRITQQDESDVIEAEKKEGSKETKYKKLARNIISNKLSTKEVMTTIPSAFSLAVQVFGFPAEVKTIGTLCLIMVSTCLSISG